MRHELRSVQPKERRIVFRIDETGGVPALTFGKHNLTITDTGVGDYLLTLNNPGALACLAVATPNQASRLARIGTTAVNTVQVLVTDLAGTPADGDVVGEIFVFDSADQF